MLVKQKTEDTNKDARDGGHRAKFWRAQWMIK